MEALQYTYVMYTPSFVDVVIFFRNGPPYGTGDAVKASREVRNRFDTAAYTLKLTDHRAVQ